MATRTKKILIGCGLGCGGLIVVVIIAFFSFAAWLNRPGELLEPSRLLGAETTGYAEWTLDLEDPGTAKFVEGLLDKQEEMQRNMPDLFPPAIQGFLNNWNSRRNRDGMRQLFPVVAAWTLSPAPEPDRDHHVFGLSVRGLGNQLVFADWIMSLIAGDDPEFLRIDHQDEIIYRFDDSFFFFMRKANMFFAEDLETARSAVERMQPRSAEAAPTGGMNDMDDLNDLFAGIPEEPPLRAGLTNGGGEVLRIWQRIAQESADPEQLEGSTSQLRGVVLTGSLEAGETLNAQLSLQAPDAAWAQEHAEQALRHFQEGLTYEGLTLVSSVRADGDWIRIDFRAENLLTFLGELMDVSVSSRAGVIVIDTTEDTEAVVEDNPELQ